MTLRRRLDRLEARRGDTCAPEVAVLRLLVTPSASGPVVVAAMARRAGETWQLTEREPGEALDAFEARVWAGA